MYQATTMKTPTPAQQLEKAGFDKKQAEAIVASQNQLLGQHLDGLMMLLQSVSEKVDALGEDSSESKADMAELKNKVDSLGKEVAATNKKVDKLEVKFDALEGRFDKLEVKVEALGENVSEVRTVVAVTDQKVDGLISALAVTDEKVGKLEVKFDALEGRFDGLEGRFDKLEVKVEALGNEVTTTNRKFDKLEIKVDGLEVKVGELGKEVYATSQGLVDFRLETIQKFSEAHQQTSKFQSDTEGKFAAVQVSLGDARISMIKWSVGTVIAAVGIIHVVTNAVPVPITTLW